jgi:preprotein translocase subunit YajC
MSLLFQILSQTAPGAGSGGGGGAGMQSLIFLLLIIVVFYFFMIRPKVRKQKEATNFRNSLKKGDRVATTGGIYGKVTDVKERTVTLEIADNVTVKVDKTAVVAEPSEQQRSR